MRVTGISHPTLHRVPPRLPRRLRHLALVLAGAPALTCAQATSPFMAGATALQTNILAWLTPIAIILVMALGAMAMANRVRSEVAERLRADYRRRVELRRERARTAGATEAAPSAERDLEEVRREARQAWLALRRPLTAERAAAQERAADTAAQADEDLTL